MQIDTFIQENKKECLRDLDRESKEVIKERAALIKNILRHDTLAAMNRASDTSVRFSDLAKTLGELHEHWAKDHLKIVGIMWKEMKKDVVVTNIWDRKRHMLVPWAVRMTHGHTQGVRYNFDMTYARFDKHMLAKFGETAVIFVERRTLPKIVLSCLAPPTLTSVSRQGDTITFLHLLKTDADGGAVFDYRQYAGLALSEMPSHMITINLREAMKNRRNFRHFAGTDGQDP